MQGSKSWLLAVLTATGTLFAVSQAAAQEPTAPAGTTTTTTTTPTTTTTTETSATATTPPAPTPPPRQPTLAAAPTTPPADTGETDHSRVVGRFGIGYYGISEVPIGPAGGRIAAPVLGARYWLMEMIGLDFGLGFATAGGSTETSAGGTTQKVDKAGAWAFMVHGGVPLSLFASKHYSFQVIPELNLGLSHQSLADTGTTNPNIVNSGLRFDVGARGGGEIHFGFMGIPELSLQGSIGLFLTHQTGSSEQGAAKSSDSTTALATTAYNNPWDLFMGNVAARYYF